MHVSLHLILHAIATKLLPKKELESKSLEILTLTLCESTTKAISFSKMVRSRFDLILKKNYLFSDFKINFRDFRDLKMNNINEDVITKTSIHKIR